MWASTPAGRRIKVLLALAALGATLAACESSSTLPERTSVDDPSQRSLGDPRTENAASDFESCATHTSVAQAKPVFLVFMFDTSGSMTVNGSPKWASAKAASKAFFESVESRGVYASLSFFPDEENYSCDPRAYSTPHVLMTSLPDKELGASLDRRTPEGGTPTYVALEGTIAYAREVAANHGRYGKVAIVLVTDGLPDSLCDGNSVADVRELAASVADTLPTYVIGVGNQLTRLQDIAIGGGTRNALIVKDDDPAQIQRDFLKAINTIKQSTLACDYEIPAPPEGERLDRDRVNVLHQSGRTTDTFLYNPSCSGGAGWRYDDPDAPKRLLLCDSSCDAVKATAGRIEVLFGCATRSLPVR